MVSIRTEKAIKKVIAAKEAASGRIDFKKNGNHTIIFDLAEGGGARFTLNSIIAKRLKKRTKKV